VLASFAAAALAATLALQWEAGRVRPIWLSAGLNDKALLTRRSSEGFGALWADSANLLACVRPGSVVAYSEMGYAFWVRPDLDAIDTRGLVDERVAHRAPASLHTIVGVVDPNWRKRDSFIGGEIARRQPHFVLSIEPDQGSSAIGGQYTLVRTDDYGHVKASLYRRRDVSC
jgi:hypothetical protein